MEFALTGYGVGMDHVQMDYLIYKSCKKSKLIILLNYPNRPLKFSSSSSFLLDLESCIFILFYFFMFDSLSRTRSTEEDK